MNEGLVQIGARTKFTGIKTNRHPAIDEQDTRPSVRWESNGKYSRQSQYFVDNELATIGEAALKIYTWVNRQTIGWRKDWDRISWSQFQLNCGLSPAGVEAGIRELLQKGLMQRRRVLNGFEYCISQPL